MPNIRIRCPYCAVPGEAELPDAQNENVLSFIPNKKPLGCIGNNPAECAECNQPFLVILSRKVCEEPNKTTITYEADSRTIEGFRMPSGISGVMYSEEPKKEY